MFKKIGKMFYVLICGVLIFQLVGCGTIMYPERKGQKSGRIDSGVAILDGIGLLFFFIPGIIAYAVDFSNGTIYLPGTLSSLDVKNLKQVKFDTKHSSMASIQEIVKKETGCNVKLYQSQMKITKLESVDEMMVQFAENSPKTPDNRIALIR
jgi:hypothetical protein